MAETPATHGSAAVDAAAAQVEELFARIHATLDGWREALPGPGDGTVDERVAALVLPALDADDPLLIGAGYIAAPEGPEGDLRFAWWLGALDDNPVFGATSGPSKLDLASRSYSEYLRDLRSLEWYRIPQSTHRTHVTGPYVDHLCACDYIVTVTSPVERSGAMIGVVGVDVYVKRLERELLPGMLAAGRPLALVNAAGRVTVSTDPAVTVGTVVAVPDGARHCAGTPFRLVEHPVGR
ncbi:cache domain-containing protein [Leifsonia sp. 22587]|uniref:cache domain-containing protein n=1 Tax=Leifsonia sp. 22587 TaxID=3453946 RepID=UPI003F829041